MCVYTHVRDILREWESSGINFIYLMMCVIKKNEINMLESIKVLYGKDVTKKRSVTEGLVATS